MLETIKKTVQTRVQNSGHLIVVGVFHNMVNSHNDFCGCDYCVLLREYVDYKIALVKARRDYIKIGEDYYEEGELYHLTEDDTRRHNTILSARHDRIENLKTKIATLKEEKDSLKKL